MQPAAAVFPFAADLDASVPQQPQGWAVVAASRSLRRGEVRRAHLLETPVAVFRGRDGRVGVLAAACPHMGAHVGGGRVTDAGLACPLHGWAFDADGTQRLGPGGAAVCRARATTAFPVVERDGAVYAFHGPDPTHPLPALPDGVRTRVGRPVTVEAPWAVVSANGFDVQHLATVHGRALREPAAWGVEDGGQQFVLRYVSRVTGRSLSDRAMQRLSGDRIAVTVRCHGGTLFLTESTVGRTTSRLIVSITPTPDGQGTVVWPVFAAGTGLAGRVTLAAASWLFRAFLMPDVEALRGIAFRAPRPSAHDAAFLDYLAYLRRLPQFDA